MSSGDSGIVRTECFQRQFVAFLGSRKSVMILFFLFNLVFVCR